MLFELSQLSTIVDNKVLYFILWIPTKYHTTDLHTINQGGANKYM